MFPYAQKKATQTEPLPGRENEMVQNDAGGYGFAVSDETLLHRFLILGTVGGIYYVDEKQATTDVVKTLGRLFATEESGLKAVLHIAAVSIAGRAVKNSPAIAALALASVSPVATVRRAAFERLRDVCRIGTHLFEFCEYRQGFGGGWGRTMRRAVAGWYLAKHPQNLAVQLLKYPSREGWSHRDLLRLSHPKGGSQVAPMFESTCRPEHVIELLPSLPKLYRGVWSVREVSEKVLTLHDGYVGDKANFVRQSGTTVAGLIREFGLTREMVPTEFLTSPEVWDALLHSGEGMPMTAMVRNLGNLSKCGLLSPLSDAEKFVIARLSDAKLLKESRLHPLSVLLALKTYAQGHGMLGKGQWEVCQKVVDALDEAFYATFTNVEPTGQNIMLGVDVSGSMTMPIAGLPITSAEAAGALALVTAATEPNYFIGGFEAQFVPLPITPKMRLDQATKIVSDRNYGNTDCAIPMQYARQHKMPVDAFVVISDAQTWAGEEHVTDALVSYRKSSGRNAKLANISTVARGHSLSDPKDAGSMDFVGFDANVPQALAEFLKG